MKKSKAIKVAKHWNDNFRGNTEETMTEATISGEGECCMVCIKNVGERNRKSAFYHVEELADVARTFRVSTFILLMDGEPVAYLS